MSRDHPVLLKERYSFLRSFTRQFFAGVTCPNWWHTREFGVRWPRFGFGGPLENATFGALLLLVMSVPRLSLVTLHRQAFLDLSPIHHVRGLTLHWIL